MMSFKSLATGIFAALAAAAFSIAATGSASAQQCPDWQLNGVPISTDAEAAWTAQSYTMYAGGVVDLLQCDETQGVGYTTAAPSFTLSYDALDMGRDLDFRVEADCDTTLLINTATSSWEFNDDDNSRDPRLLLSEAPSGRYDIWVGTYGEQSCQATLIAETLPHVEAVCPDWTLGGAQINSTAGQSSTHPVVAGGAVNLFEGTCDVPGHGYVAQAPDFSLYFDPMGQASTLTISATGDCDETLLISDANSQWLFNDDATDLHPGLTIENAAAGRYDIWVGTFGEQACQSTLSVSSTGQAPQPTAPAAPAAPSK